MEQLEHTYHIEKGNEPMYSFDEVKKADPEVAQAITDEMERQNSHI